MSGRGGAGGGGKGCTCEHVHEAECPEGESLLPAINTTRVRCLNEQVVGSAKHVFKTFADKGNKSDELSVQSPPGDSDLLFSIPFTSSVRIRAICVSGAPDGRSPARADLYINQENLDFAGAEASKPVQSIELPYNPDAEAWISLKPKFANVDSLQIRFAGAQGGEDSDVQVYCILLKGEISGLKRSIVTAVYEARALPEDHQVEDEAGAQAKLGL